VSKTQTVIAPNSPLRYWYSEDGTLYVYVLNIDTDSDGDSICIRGGSASKGTPSISGTRMKFKPDPNYNGSTTVNYSLSDGNVGTDSGIIYVTVTPVNDSPTGSVSVSGEVNVGQTLTLSQSLSDLDGLGSFSYRWYRSVSTINGATASSYKLTNNDAGHKIKVRLSYVDGNGTSERKTSGETAAVYSSAGNTQSRFVHTDLLGSPVAEPGN